MANEVPTVKTIEEIEANIVDLDEVRTDPNHKHFGEYVGLIHRGTTFFTYKTDSGEVAFVPSRFVGYKKNNIGKHIKNRTKKLIDGRVTNVAIDKIVSGIKGKNAVSRENNKLEKLYESFCNSLGIKYKERKVKKRKYWDFYDLSGKVNSGDSNGTGKRPSNSNSKSEEANNMETTNLILYGPPGTGKTFQTAIEAVKICLGDNAPDENDREAIMKKYHELSLQGRVEFVTFHQSFSYQEFVEGLRPVTENKYGKESSSGFSLKPHDGIFKKICNRALRRLQKEGLDRNKPVYQVTVNHSWISENDYIEKCLKESVIHFGWAIDVDWSNSSSKDKKGFAKEWKTNVRKEELNNTGGRDQTFAFRFGSKEGDYVILTDGRKKFVAFGIIVGPYRYSKDDSEIPHYRKVNWLWVDRDGRHHSEFYPEIFKNHSFYRLVHRKIDWDGLEQIVSEQDSPENQAESFKNVGERPARGKFARKLLKPLCSENPRQKGSHGWNNYEILLKNRVNGIMYEDYLAQGGRWRDLDYDFKNGWVSVQKVPTANNLNDPSLSYVLIIDEINRANISKVFGELITLLEVDKRIDRLNELQVRLPYSGELFGVPQNLHILGTMNTADRSIALLDTALRRRFKFRELMPDLNSKELSKVREKFNNIKLGKNGNLSMFLQKINMRIQYLYDREHQIGHSYFIGCETEDDVAKVIRDDIIPLLAEYFFEDREKIAKVLEDKMDEADSGKFVGCFFVKKKLETNFHDDNNQDSQYDSKWQWIVKDDFEFVRLVFP